MWTEAEGDFVIGHADVLSDLDQPAVEVVFGFAIAEFEDFLLVQRVAG